MGIPRALPLSRLAARGKRVRTRLVRAARSRVGGPAGHVPRGNHELVNITIPAEVVVYFPDDLRKLYQLEQWLPVFEQLHQRHSLLIVTRNVATARALRQQTDLRTLYVRRFNDLMTLYTAGDYKIAIYVNNAVNNFQSLAAPRMLHIHVNHGESDKICNVSNQVKAYDRIFVAGDAAVERHRAALLNHDLAKLVKVGRPQLDVDVPALLPATQRRTLVYAPTWEGEDELNNYTSLDTYGERILSALLAVPNARVVYRPHPRIPHSSLAQLQAAHTRMVERIEAARAADPAAGHTISLKGSILSVFRRCDLMVADVSSVGLDFLYRHADKPLFVTDRRDDRAQLLADSPITSGADIIDSSTLPELSATVAQRLDHDTLRPTRSKLRDHYYDGLLPGESVAMFLDAASNAIAERDALLHQQDATPVTA